MSTLSKLKHQDICGNIKFQITDCIEAKNINFLVIIYHSLVEHRNVTRISNFQSLDLKEKSSIIKSSINN